MNVIDSSAWLAYVADTRNAGRFSKPISDYEQLVVPTIVMFEVMKVLLREKSEEAAILVQAHMQEGTVADLTPRLAIRASHLSLEYKLPMADSIILATARQYDAVVWTQDADFKGLDGVKFYKA